MHTDRLDDIVNKYNNATIIEPLKLILLMSNQIYILTLIKKTKKEGRKFKVHDNVRLSKYKNIFAEGYAPIGLKKFLWLKKLKILFRGHFINDLNGVKIVGTFDKKDFQKTKQK